MLKKKSLAMAAIALLLVLSTSLSCVIEIVLPAEGPEPEPGPIAGSESNIDVELSATQVEAGESITITVRVSPPQVTPVNASLDNQKSNEVVLVGSAISTDKNGVATITRKVGQPGDVVVSVIAPELGLKASADIEVIPARPKPQREVTKDETIGSGGGTVELPSGAGMFLPEGALDATTKVTVAIVSGMPQPRDSNMKLGPKVYEFQIDGKKNPDAAPTIVIPYDESDLPSGVSADQLQIVYYDESAWDWIPVGGEVDTQKKLIQLTSPIISSEYQIRPFRSKLSQQESQVTTYVADGILDETAKLASFTYSYLVDKVYYYETANFKIDYLLDGPNAIPPVGAYDKDRNVKRLGAFLEKVRDELITMGFKTRGVREVTHRYTTGGYRLDFPRETVERKEVIKIQLKIRDIGNLMGQFSGITDEGAILEINSKFLAFGLEEDLYGTAAHEFFHMTQALYLTASQEFVGSVWFDEASALWFEDVMMDKEKPGANTYIALLEENRNFIKDILPYDTTSHGYGACAFVKYLTSVIGKNTVREIYEEADRADSRAIDAVAKVLEGKYGKKLEQVFSDFAIRYCVFRDFDESASWKRPFDQPGAVETRTLSSTSPSATLKVNQAQLSARRYIVHTEGIKGDVILAIDGGNADQSIKVFVSKGTVVDDPRSAFKGELTAQQPLLDIPLEGGLYIFDLYAINANRNRSFTCNLEIGGLQVLAGPLADPTKGICALKVVVLPRGEWYLSVTDDIGGIKPFSSIGPTDENGELQTDIIISKDAPCGEYTMTVEAEREINGKIIKSAGSGRFTVPGITIAMVPIMVPAGGRLVVSGQVYPRQKTYVIPTGLEENNPSALFTDDAGQYTIFLSISKDAKDGETGTLTVVAKVYASESEQPGLQDIVVENSATYVVSGSPVQTPTLPPVPPTGPAIDLSRVGWCGVGINVLSHMEVTGWGAETVKELEPITMRSRDLGIMRGKFVGNTFTGSGNFHVSSGDIPAKISIDFDPSSQQITSFRYSVSGSAVKGSGRTINLDISGSSLPYLKPVPEGNEFGGHAYGIVGKQVCSHVTMSFSFRVWGVENGTAVESRGTMKSLQCDDKSELAILLGWGSPE